MTKKEKEPEGYPLWEEDGVEYFTKDLALFNIIYPIDTTLDFKEGAFPDFSLIEYKDKILSIWISEKFGWIGGTIKDILTDREKDFMDISPTFLSNPT